MVAKSWMQKRGSRGVTRSLAWLSTLSPLGTVPQVQVGRVGESIVRTDAGRPGPVSPGMGSTARPADDGVRGRGSRP